MFIWQWWDWWGGHYTGKAFLSAQGPLQSNAGFPYELPFTFDELIQAAFTADGVVEGAHTRGAGTFTADGVADFVGGAALQTHASLWAIPPRSMVSFDQPLYAQCEQIWEYTTGAIAAEDQLRKQEPLVRLWDGDWNLMHICSVEYKATFSWISNDTGPGQMQLPYDSEAARWIQDFDGRVKRGAAGAPFDVHRNVHITVDYCGARWSGRLDKSSVEKREDGDVVLVCDFLHDYENL